jgi:hypothetical protein
VKYNGVLAVLVGAVVIASSGTVMSFSGVTFASFSDTVASTPDRLGAATVVLGRGGKGPDLKYDGLRPGVRQEVELRLDYDGSVPADVSLVVGPDRDAQLCSRTGNGRWVAAPGRAVTISVGGAPAVSYCSLYVGGRLPLATRVAPGSRVTTRVGVTLAADFVPPAGGLTERGIVTVRADGGFTDNAVGAIELRVDRPAKGAPATGPATPPAVAATGDANAVALDPTDPASAARSAAATAIALPAQCVAAGMSASDLAEVVVLDATEPSWDAAAQRGAGAGPFLVLGTAGDDTVVGSDGADCIVGGGGADTLSGGGGADVVVGGDGADTLNGDSGDDRLDGGEGHDTLRGGRGADRLDAGPDGAGCDLTADDRSVGCDSPDPVLDPAAAAPPAEPLPAAPVVPEPEPAPPAGPAADAPEPERAPADEPDPRPSGAHEPSPPQDEPPPARDAAAADQEPQPAAAPKEQPTGDSDGAPTTTTEPAASTSE